MFCDEAIFSHVNALEGILKVKVKKGSTMLKVMCFVLGAVFIALGGTIIYLGAGERLGILVGVALCLEGVREILSVLGVDLHPLCWIGKHRPVGYCGGRTIRCRKCNKFLRYN